MKFWKIKKRELNNLRWCSKKCLILLNPPKTSWKSEKAHIQFIVQSFHKDIRRINILCVKEQFPGGTAERESAPLNHSLCDYTVNVKYCETIVDIFDNILGNPNL